jgi:hypothetical protein
MLELTDPKSPLTPAEQLVHGVDATRHGLLGIPVGHTGGSPHEQAKNFLRSLREATASNVTGRQCDLSQDEFVYWMRELDAWHQTHEVTLPAPVMPLDHKLHRR